MLDKVQLAAAIQEATMHVFATMLDAVVYPAAAQEGETENGIVSLVGLTGDWSGTGTFCCSTVLAGRIASKMFLTEPDPIDAITDDVLDATAELTNMIVGNIKNDLELALGPMGISIPTVVYGKNFHYRNRAALQAVQTGFVCAGETFDVRICLTRTAGDAPSRQRLAIPSFAV